MIGNLFHQGLFCGLPSSQPVEPDVVFFEVHLTAHQPPGPVRVYREVMTKEGHLSSIRGPAQINHRPLGHGLQIDHWVFRKGMSGRSGLLALGVTTAMSGDIPIRTLLESPQAWVMVPVPDFALPQAVEPFDGRLEPRFPGWGEHHDHSQVQAQSGDRADHIGMLMGSLEDRVVVELDVVGQPHFLPVCQNRLADPLSREPLAGLGHGQSPPQRDSGHDLEYGSVLDFEVLHQVELVQLSLPHHHRGEVPARGWRRPADPLLSVQCPLPLQDPSDGPGTGQGQLRVGDLKFLADGLCSVFAQDAFSFQAMPGLDHQPFQVGVGPVHGDRSTAGSIAPVHLIEWVIPSSGDPALDGQEAHTEPAGNRSLRFTGANRADHGPTPLFCGTFLPLVGAPYIVFDHYN